MDATTHAAGWSLTTTAQPAEEPVSLAEAKEQIRVDHTAEDKLLARLIRAARERAEMETGKRWVTQTVTFAAADFGRWCRHGYLGGRVVYGLMQLPVEPVQSVAAVRYWDAAGVQQTLSGSDYQTWLAHSPPLLYPAPGRLWPATQCGRVPAVEIEVVAGYGPVSAVPAAVKETMLLMIGDWYEHRGDSEPWQHGLSTGVLRMLRLLSTGGYC